MTSLVERKSRFTFLLPNEDKRSAAVVAGITDALRALPEEAPRTVTFDRGTEFAAYAELARELDGGESISVNPNPLVEGWRREPDGGPALPPPRAGPRRSPAPPSAGSPTGRRDPAARPGYRTPRRSPSGTGGPDRPALTSPPHRSPAG